MNSHANTGIRKAQKAVVKYYRAKEFNNPDAGNYLMWRSLTDTDGIIHLIDNPNIIIAAHGKINQPHFCGIPKKFGGRGQTYPCVECGAMITLMETCPHYEIG